MPRRYSRAAHAALVLAVVAQLFAIAAAAFGDARAPSRLGVHVEQAGLRQHYVHDESTCLACAARHLVAIAPRPHNPQLASVLRGAQATCGAVAPDMGRRRTSAVPRAPPRAV